MGQWCCIDHSGFSQKWDKVYICRIQLYSLYSLKSLFMRKLLLLLFLGITMSCSSDDDGMSSVDSYLIGEWVSVSPDNCGDEFKMNFHTNGTVNIVVAGPVFNEGQSTCVLFSSVRQFEILQNKLLLESMETEQDLNLSATLNESQIELNVTGVINTSHIMVKR